MRLKGISTEDFVNYKDPSIFLSSCICDFKCCRESGLDTGVCQNAPLAQMPNKEIDNQSIYSYFVNDPITKAVVIGGMEPMLQIDEIFDLLATFRNNGCDAIFVIYTGYYPDEIKEELDKLRQYPNVIVKFGRYIPDRPTRHDDVIGITLASDNQYAEQIS